MQWNILYKNNETYCVSCKKNTVNKKSSVRKTEQNRLMLVQIALFVIKENQSSLKSNIIEEIRVENSIR